MSALMSPPTTHRGPDNHSHSPDPRDSQAIPSGSGLRSSPQTTPPSSFGVARSSNRAAADDRKPPHGSYGAGVSSEPLSPKTGRPIREEDDFIYQLEIAQNPSRGRTCGFGDADRRALSAPLIARLRVYSATTRQEIPAEDVDISFLVCAADLWSADTKQDMNLVQHSQFPLKPGASPALEPRRSLHTQDVYVLQRPPTASTPAATRPSTTEMSHLSLHSAPTFSNPFLSDRRLHSRGHPTMELPPSNHTAMPSVLSPTSTAFMHAPPPFPSPSILRYADAQRLGSSGEVPPSQRSPTSSTFAFSAPYGMYASGGDAFAFDSRRHSSSSSARPPRTGSSSATSRPFTSWTHHRPSTSATSVSMFPSSSSHGPPGTAVTVAQIPPPLPPTLDPEYACMKNLVGALAMPGYKLKAPGESEHGIFFIFHDLSVRTEGSFTIRLRLVSVGSLATGLHTGSRRTLTHTFSHPFEVMSAKKFPGMLDPTPMSQAFAKQGVRIPTRKGANRKRRRATGGNAIGGGAGPTLKILKGRSGHEPTPVMEDDEEEEEGEPEQD